MGPILTSAIPCRMPDDTTCFRHRRQSGRRRHTFQYRTDQPTANKNYSRQWSRPAAIPACLGCALIGPGGGHSLRHGTSLARGQSGMVRRPVHMNSPVVQCML